MQYMKTTAFLKTKSLIFCIDNVKMHFMMQLTVVIHSDGMGPAESIENDFRFSTISCHSPNLSLPCSQTRISPVQITENLIKISYFWTKLVPDCTIIKKQSVLYVGIVI